MRAWGLYSARVDTYAAHELLEVFADEGTAELVKGNLFGLPAHRMWGAYPWEDDDDLPDLYVRPLEIR